MKLYDLNPYLRRGAIHTLEPHWIMPTRVIFDYMLMYTERGECTLIINGQSFPQKSGDFVLIPPGVSHGFIGGPKPCVRPHIHFDICWDNYSDSRYISFLDLPAMSALERRMIAQNCFFAYPLQPFVSFKDPQRMKDLLYSLTTEDPPNYTPEKKARLTELIGMIIEDNYPDLLTQTIPEGASVAHSIRNFLDFSYASKITLRDLESQFYYDKFYLESQFRKQYHMPIMAYRKKKRLEIGADLLRHNSVSRVAEKVGYSSVFVFCRAFKEHFHMTPTEYVKLHYNDTCDC